MFHKLMVALGICFPHVSDVVRGASDCVRIGSRAYFVRNKAAFAEAFSNHLDIHRGSSTDSLAHKFSLHEDLLLRAVSLDYPCVVFFSTSTFDSISVDEPPVEYPTL